MLVYFAELVLGQGHMVLEGFGMLVLGVGYSVVGYYTLGRMKYAQRFGDYWGIGEMVLLVGM